MGRLLPIAFAVAALSACGRPAPIPPQQPPPPPTWSLVLENVVVDDPGTGSVPVVFVTATVDGNEIDSPMLTTVPDPMGGYFDGTFGTPLLSAEQPVLESGVDLQVFADFGNGPEQAGEAFYQPPAGDFGAGVIDLGAFGNVADLTVELTLD